jgi:hypothetical protein
MESPVLMPCLQTITVYYSKNRNRVCGVLLGLPQDGTDLSVNSLKRTQVLLRKTFQCIFFFIFQYHTENPSLLQDFEWFQEGSGFLVRIWIRIRTHSTTADVSSRLNNCVCCSVYWGAGGEECAQLEAVNGGGRGGGTRK